MMCPGLSAMPPTSAKWKSFQKENAGTGTAYAVSTLHKIRLQKTVKKKTTASTSMMNGSSELKFIILASTPSLLVIPVATVPFSPSCILWETVKLHSLPIYFSYPATISACVVVSTAATKSSRSSAFCYLSHSVSFSMELQVSSCCVVC